MIDDEADWKSQIAHCCKTAASIVIGPLHFVTIKLQEPSLTLNRTIDSHISLEREIVVTNDCTIIKAVELANFMYTAIYSFSSKHEFKLELEQFHTSRWTRP